MVTAAPGGARWYHQHFAVSKDPLRLTAWFGPFNPGPRSRPARREAHRLYRPSTSPKAAPPFRTGWKIRTSGTEYDARLKAEGVENRMRAEYYDKNYKGPLPTE